MNYIINTATNLKCAAILQSPYGDKNWSVIDRASGEQIIGKTALSVFRLWVRGFVGPVGGDKYPYHWYGVTVPQRNHYQREVTL